MLNKIGLTELIIVAVVVVLLFGARKMPELGKGLGDAIKSLKSAFRDEEDKEKKVS